MASTAVPHLSSESISNLGSDGIPPSDDRLAIQDLVSRSEATINSVYSFLRGFSDCSSFDGGDLFPDKGFCCCPFDSRHRMPPESLFRHWLRCNSAPGGPLLDLEFLETMRYPKSFKSEEELKRENHFLRHLPESGVDLCFSLEKDLEDVGGSSFFYRDCPGVVSFPELDVSARTFSLPRGLALECANFISSDCAIEDEISRTRSLRIFPSETWAFRKEIEAWKDYPTRYSFIAVQIASCLAEEAGDFGFRKWVLTNSPRFGIIIDAAMSDHLYLLLKLCLNAIWREALSSLKLLSLNDSPLDQRSSNLNCPRLSEVMAWLASQLSILYGEINGKNLSISMIGESLIHVGSNFLVFPLDDGSTSAETRERKSGKVYVSQIAAAIAALHERAMLEERVKQARLHQPLSTIQLLHELSNVSARAHEERSKRPNYRPILEYDGLLSKKSHNQDKARTKTPEELLAEERDYKRRRMSYRGKKVKRTTIQVIRDIIEDYMQEITEASGIGCHIGESAVSEISSSLTPQKSTSDKRTHVAADVAADDRPRERHVSQGNHGRNEFEILARSSGHVRSRDQRNLGSENRGPSYSSRSRRDFSENSPSSSSSLSTERFHHVPERRKQSRQRSHDFHTGERVPGTKFEDRYDPFDAS